MASSSKRTTKAKNRGHTRRSNVSDRSDLVAENRQASHPVLQLQRRGGNSAATQMIRRTQDSPPESNQVRIQRDDDDSIWDSLVSGTTQFYRGAGQFFSGDMEGLAETVGVADTIDDLWNDPVGTSMGVVSEGFQWMDDHPYGLLGDWLGYGREDE